MTRALLVVAMAIVGICVVGVGQASKKTVDWQAKYQRSHAVAVKQRHRADDLQLRLTRRVHEATGLRRALKRRIATEFDSPLEQGLLCIHLYEAGWHGSDNATHNTYFGGLQMDREFQRTYGREFYDHFGTADRWPVSVQIAVAIKAYLSGRGFHPWPNTSRMCGL